MENNENIEFMEGKKLNEIKCARFIKDVLGLAYEDKTFFSTRGRYRSEDELRQEIFTLLQDYVTSGVARKVENVLGVLRFVAAETKMDDSAMVLNVANGTFNIQYNQFLPQKFPCRYRLPVEFHREANAPRRWLEFLNDLLERKGVQSYQGRLYVRFMAFGNGTLQSLYDRSHGFFRRQIILSAKPRPSNRVDDPYLSEKLLEEINGIFAWCLFGLVRLIENDFRFTISSQAVENMEESKAEGNNIVEFMKSSGFFLYSTAGTITSRKFYNLYTQWCDDNATKPLSSNSFCSYLRQEADYYGLRYNKHIDIGEGRQARGFTGVVAIY